MDYSKYQFLLVDVKDGIALVTINRPERANAVNHKLHEEFGMILRDLGRDEDVKVAVLTGAGNNFSPGGDLEMMEDLNAHPGALNKALDDARELIYAHIDLEKPIIAALNGVAMGAGLAFAVLCDIIIMERQGRIADGHIRGAIVAGDGGALMWPLTVGLTKAKRYLLTGDWLTAEEAERIGLITEVVEKGQAVKRAFQIAERLAAGPQTAIRYTKKALNQWLRLGAVTAFDYSLALEFITFPMPEVKKALSDLKDRKPGAIPPE